MVYNNLRCPKEESTKTYQKVPFIIYEYNTLIRLKKMETIETCQKVLQSIRAFWLG